MKYDYPNGCFAVPPDQIQGAVAAGCDIRPGSWDLILGEVILNNVGIAVCKPVFIGKVRDEADVLFTLRQYRCRIAVADTRPETTLAKRLQVSAREFGITVWRAEYNTAPSSIPIQTNESEGVLKLDRTMALDDVHYAFQSGNTVILPQNYNEITSGDFSRELQSSTRVPTRWMGKDCYTWEHAGPDHAFHAFGYLKVAIQKGGLAFSGGYELMAPSKGMSSGKSDGLRTKLSGKKTEIDWDEEEAKDGEFYFEA